MIIRAVHNKDKPYFMVRRSTAQDVNLPARALGLLVYLLSKPGTWEPTIKDIRNRFPDIGKNQAYKIINEIFIPLGYARRVRERKGGRFWRWVTEIYEEPVTDFGEMENPENRENDFPENREELEAEPVPENREAVTISRLPVPENRELDINRVQNTELLHEENTEQQQAAGPRRIAAAASSDFQEEHKSVFSRFTVEEFVKAKKPHATNPGGLARKFWRTGEEDSAISQWMLAKEKRRKREEQTAASESEIASDFDMDAWVDDLIANSWIPQLENELEQINERGGPKLPWERRVAEYFNRGAETDAA